jgi:hypothetical protein
MRPCILAVRAARRDGTWCVQGVRRVSRSEMGGALVRFGMVDGGFGFASYIDDGRPW